MFSFIIKKNIYIYHHSIVRGRMIQDRTFFMSELRHKVSLVTNEINKLNNEINVIEKENENYDAFEKKYEYIYE